MPDSLSGKKVLIAEDNAINAMVLTRYLKKWGMEADIVTDGLVCIDKAVTGRYDLILMDMQMPEMDGVEATRQIRKNDSHPYLKTVPVIAITANSESDVFAEVKAAGMNDLITKPFDPDELREKLLKILG